MAKTKTLLIEDLEKVKQTGKVKEIIKRAKRGVYHDYESPLPVPKNQLYVDLLDAGLADLANEVMAGRYD